MGELVLQELALEFLIVIIIVIYDINYSATKNKWLFLW